MEMKLANKESKSILAKLLATENVTVEHGKYNTASFDVKNRVLRLPIWKEMSGNLYDLLVLHEVGHALFTPEEGFHDAEGYGRGFKSFLNVVEDARIERKIKIKYPGGRRAFVDGYANLMERDFFGIKHEDLTGLGLIDKINLHYKVGSHVDLTFSDEESVFLDRIDKANTWKEVVKICEDLWEYAKENESETDMSDHDWDEAMMRDDEEEDDYDFEESDSDDSNEENSESLPSPESEEGNSEETENECENGNSSSEKSDEENDEGSTSDDLTSEADAGESGEFMPESKTDRNFRNKETDLVSEESKPYVYVNIPNKANLKKIIIDHKELYKRNYKRYYEGDEVRRHSRSTGNEMREAATKLFSEFRVKNKKIVEYLAKEFEMKKAASEHARAATANSGILDSSSLHTYKYNEHLFKKLTIVPNGKNHGLVMFVDWSGSMSRNMKGTIEQMMILVMFCKRVNIPFEVYAFSDSYTRYNASKETEDWVDSNNMQIGEGMTDYGTIALPRFNLLNLFSSRMKAKELHEAYIYMTATADYYDNKNYYYYSDDTVSFYLPERMHLGGTPLNHTLFVSFQIMREFQKRNHVDVINNIFLTDGDSHGCNSVWEGEEGEGRRRYKNFDTSRENVIFRDSVSKKEIKLKGYGGWARSNGQVTSTLVTFLRNVFDINCVNFYIVNKMRRWDMAEYLSSMSENSTHDYVDVALRKFRKEKYHIAPECKGFNEQYTIMGGKSLEVSDEELVVAEGATVAQMTKAFKKFSGGKLEKRKLLSRFISMIAA